MKDLIKELNMIPGIHFNYYCSDESDPGQYEFGCCSNFCSAADIYSDKYQFYITIK